MSFEIDLTRHLNNIKKGSSNVIRKAGVSAYRTLTELTPVDTGRAKGNWYPGKNFVNQTATEDTSFDSARGEGEFGDAKAGDTLNISNSLPYIEKLENGSSDQAPNGMVRRTALILKQQIESGKFND